MNLKTILKIFNLPALIFVFLLFTYAFSSSSNPTVSIAISKMNVLYIGVDNPVVVAIAGVNSDKTEIESEDIGIRDLGEGHYVLTATKPGSADLRVKANGQVIKKERFRIKRIPDPQARIGNRKGGLIKASIIHASQGMQAILECFNFDARCSIGAYDVIRIRDGADPLLSVNKGARYTTLTQEIVQSAKAGDTIYFEQIKCKCPGDRASRALNSLEFKIR